MEKNINILFCLNDGYLYPMINMIFSITKYHSNCLNIYILSTKFSKKSEQILLKKCKSLNVKFQIKRIDFDVNFISGTHFTVDMFLRIFAYKYLPTEIDKILYMDADMLTLKDISEIYEQNIDNKILGAVIDIENKTNFITSIKKNLNINHEYFNSGLLLLNLKKIRETWIEDAILSVIDKYNKNLHMPDQDVLNVLCSNDDILFLNSNYNYQLRRKFKDYNLDNVVILHFIGANKPWNRFFLKKHEKIFWKNFKITKCYAFYFKSFFMKINRTTKLIIINAIAKSKKFAKCLLGERFYNFLKRKFKKDKNQ